MGYSMIVIHFSPLKSGQPLYSGQISWSQCVLYTEISLYIYFTNSKQIRIHVPVRENRSQCAKQFAMATEIDKQ